MRNRINQGEWRGTVVTNLEGEDIHLSYDASRMLGRGQYAIVYCAYSIDSDRADCGLPVALKVQKTRVKHSSQLRKNMDEYAREVDIMSALTLAKADNVVSLYGVYVEMISPTCYESSIAMTYAAVGPLDNLLGNPHVEIDFPYKIGIACGIAAGVKAIHNLDIIHGDLKPANVVLDTSLKPMLCDFGLSERIGVDPTCISGTPCFMSPAMLLAYYSHYDVKRSKADDIYSLSFLIWCIYAEQEIPFESIQSPRKLIDDVCHKNIREPLPACPPAAKRLIMQGWAPNPKLRPTAEQALGILKSTVFKAPVLFINKPRQPASAVKVRERAKSFSGKMAPSFCRSRFFEKRNAHSHEAKEKQPAERKRMC